VDPAGFSSSPSPSGSPSVEFATLPLEPSPAPSPSSSATPSAAPTGPREWTIAIDTIGYQPELDACLWVRYRVTEEREAHAGDNAATATEGLVADDILQTCHGNSAGRERLVSLVRA